jgi:nitrite reductase/ring-hydroxylating ferredoxin subunit
VGRMPFQTVARIGDLSDGDIIPVSAAGEEMVLYRTGEQYFAAQRRCLHQGFDLTQGIVSQGFLICALHGWRYHVATGKHELSPETCLKTYAVRVFGDLIQVDPAPIWQGDVPS